MTPLEPIPTFGEAERLLAEAEVLNPGPWVQHSRVAAQAACSIAAHLPGLDAEAAAVLGLLHDIGRRSGVSGMRHIFDGYDYLLILGYPGAARICLTHSFPLPDLHAFLGAWDVSPQQIDFIQAYLAGVQHDRYDQYAEHLHNSLHV